MSKTQSERQVSRDTAQSGSRARDRLVRALGLAVWPGDPHLSAVLQALGDEVLDLHEEVARLRRALQASAQLADCDALCPVFNRRAFLRELKREIALASRFGTPLSLIFLDMDGFKAINDRFGHATGDAVLKRISDMLRASTRDTDIIGRLGGDEFGIALPHATMADATQKADRLSDKISRLSVRPDEGGHVRPTRLGASFGVAEWTPEFDPETLISEADMAMYAAKPNRNGGVRDE